MKVCVADPEMAVGLAGIGGPDGDARDGLVFAPAAVEDWERAENELARAFSLTQEATLADAPVIYLLDSRAALGRAGVFDSAVAVGLVAAGRCLAFEGQRTGQYAAVIATESDYPPARVAGAISFAVGSRTGLGQTIMLGSSHLGAMLP